MNILHKFCAILAATSISFGAIADDCNIHFMVAPIEQGDDVPDEINDLLMTRLAIAVTATGVVASPDVDRFFITGKINHLYKDVVPGPPISSVMRSTLTLYVGDVINHKVYATTSFDLRGVGTSESRAFVNALSQLNGKNAKLIQFVEKGRQKVLDYYNKEYPSLIRQAQQAASLKNFEEALSIVTSIPECCVGYEQAYNATLSIYDKYINYVCHTLISKARAAWSASPDEYGAQSAYSFLTQIDPDASCYAEATALHNEIKKVVKENWDFENKEKYRDAVETERRKIEAARAVGVAFGNGQQPVTTNLMWLE